VPARTDLTLTEAAVLALLAIEGECSGYDLLKLAQKSVGHVWAPAKSQLYATLGRLTRAGLVEGRTVAQAERPDKQLYRITREGNDRVQAWLEDTATPDRSAQTLKIFLGGLVPLETLVAHVERFRADVDATLALYRAIELENSRRGHDFFHYQVLRLGIATAEASLRWADETLAELRSPAARSAQRAAVRHIHFAPDGAGTA
jgi:PadR family transcriptional regulator AphA